jgi:hypothetical protein
MPCRSNVDQNEAGERLPYARLFYSVTPIAPHLAQFQKGQLQDMLLSISPADEEIANVVNCSARTVRSARADQHIFGGALLDHLLTKS